MRRLLWLAVAATALGAGCKNLKDEQLPQLVGNSDTKTYYKNVEVERNKVPEAKRVYFKSMDEAMAKGYHSAAEGSDAPTQGDE